MEKEKKAPEVAASTERELKSIPVIKRYEAGYTERKFHDPMVKQAFSYQMPRKAGFDEESNFPKSPTTYMEDLYDMTAPQANNILSSGEVSEMTPIAETWFGYEHDDELTDSTKVPEDAKKYYEQCTKIVRRELEKANFYSQIHEVFLERNVAGTGCILTMEGKKNTLNFTALDWGSYVIGEDDERNVTYLGRKIRLNAANAVKKFGKENLPPKILENLDNEAKMNEKFVFIHEVSERDDTERNTEKRDGVNKPWSSKYVCENPKWFIKEGGFEEQPYGCSRFNRWPGFIYGWGPGLESLPLCRRTNFIEKLDDTLVETKANPRVLSPAGYEDSMDLRAGGVTPMDENAKNIPHAWATEGDNRSLKEKLDDLKEDIRGIFYNDLFQLLAGIDPGKMTAYETMQRLAEKLNRFSPTFQLITTELLAPSLSRAFNICLRAGKFPEAPDSVLVPLGLNSKGEQEVGMSAPKVVFSSKIALAMKALENRAFMDFIQIMLPLFAEFPEMKDNMASDEVFRKMARDMGVSFALEDTKVRDDIRKARQEQVEKEQAMMAAESAGRAGNDLGGAPQALQDQVLQSVG